MLRASSVPCCKSHMFSTLLGLLILYLVKSALGIDLVPGFSLGTWGWFKGEFLN